MSFARVAGICVICMLLMLSGCGVPDESRNAEAIRLMENNGFTQIQQHGGY